MTDISITRRPRKASTDRVVMDRWLLPAILILAPWTKLPIAPGALPFRPVDIVIAIAALCCLRLRWRARCDARLGLAMLVCYAVSVVSAAWGFWYLDGSGLATVFQDGIPLAYWTVAARKLVLLALSFLGFQYVAQARGVGDSRMLRYWHHGLAIAFAFHLLSYALSSDVLMQRAGVFVEGNHGGSYYLLSFFLMWRAWEQRQAFGGRGMVMSFAGIVLTQSTASIALFVPLGIACLLLQRRAGRGLRRRSVAALIMVAAVVVVGLFFSAEIATKLLAEDVDATSFSRYDRLASIASGWAMFEAHPLFGVGIQGYAFALPLYVDDFILSFFAWDFRRIANNIYIELLAEQGLIGLTAMLLVLIGIAAPFRGRRGNWALRLGFLSVLLSWLAFPTYTVSFHWIGFALMYRLAARAKAMVPASAIRPAQLPSQAHQP